MKTITVTENKNEYVSACLSLSHTLLIFSIVIAILLQGMTFFVALNGGLGFTQTLIFALIPILGPLFCSFLLIFAGTGAPLILIALFVPFALTLLGSAYFRDECSRSQGICKENTQSFDDNISLVKIAPKPLPLPTPREKPKPEPLPDFGPVPKPKPLTKPQPTPESKPITLSVTENKSTCEPTPQKREAEEYGKVLEDVLAILNKR